MRRPNFLSSLVSYYRRPAAGDPIIPILVFVVTLIAGLAAMLALLPGPVVLPVFSLWSLIAAAFIALIACLRPRLWVSRGVTAWDVVGAFTLIGCAAAILGEIEHMVEYLSAPSSRSKAND